MSDHLLIEAVLRAYFEVRSHPEPARREELLRVCWTEDSAIIGPGYYFKGTRAVLEEIARFQLADPGARPVLSSGFDAHGRWARFSFVLLDANDAEVNEGWDLVEFREDGKIHRVVSFWGKLPPTPADWPERLLPSAGGSSISARRDPTS